MRVLVVGATGVLGRNVVARLLEHGHQVRAVVRQEAQAARLQRLGVEPCLGDILELATLLPAAAGCDVALHLATAIPRPDGPQDWSLNDRIRREGTRNLLEAALQGGVRRYVQQSVTLVYGPQDGRTVDETAALDPPPPARSAVDMEQVVQASPLAWCILRGGCFYGPGTGAEDGWRAALRAGRLRLLGDGTQRLSLIHVVDMARAVVMAVERAPERLIYNVVDDQPVSSQELYGYLAAQLGLPVPEPGGPAPTWPACGNARLTWDLGWRPAYDSYRSGLVV